MKFELKIDYLGKKENKHDTDKDMYHLTFASPIEAIRVPKLLILKKTINGIWETKKCCK